MFLPPLYALPAIIAETCNVSFHNDSRVVILDIQDTRRVSVELRMPDHLMAHIAGQFMRVRLFGLH